VLNFPWLVEEVAEELAGFDIPEPELERLRRQILEAETALPGLDAPALRQHLVQNGLAATVAGLLAPSADAIFLVRCSDPPSTRAEWARLAGVLKEGDYNALAEATNDLVSEISPDNWERFLAARERALDAGPAGEDQA
jgi:hypothetical protein